MTTLYTIILLIVFSAVVSFIGVFVLNIAGLPGAFIAGRQQTRSKMQLKIGIIVSAIGQSYIYLAYQVWIINWTFAVVTFQDVTNFIVWGVTFLAVYLPVLKMRTIARLEDDEFGSFYRNPQVEALDITTIVSFVAFFVFVFIPSTMNSLWGWVFKIVS